MLFGSTVLEVAIGLVFVYLLLSLLCSAVNEYVESKLNYRARDLERGIRMLLNDPGGTGLAKTVYEHPLVRGLYRDGARLPSYIPSKTFMLALWNTATSAASGVDAASAGVSTKLQSIREAVNTLPDREVRTAINTLIDEAQGNLARAQRNIEEWYDSAMDRVSGWYKRRTQWILLGIGLAVSVLINADTVNIAKSLVQDSALRSSIVEAADTARRDETFRAGVAGTAGAAQPTDPAARARAAEENIQRTRAQLSSLGLPVGWTLDRTMRDDPRGRPVGVAGWVLKLFGLFLTALAISQGAPFWFDLLNKFMVIRSTVKPHEKSREQPSKDKPAPETERTEAEE